MLRVATCMTSWANGPGYRYVVWVQGCSLGCHGCVNKFLWPKMGGELVAPEALVKRTREDDADGLTFTGGEPLEQAQAVMRTAKLAQEAGLSVVLFTGFTMTEIQKGFPGALNDVDIVIAGRWDYRRRTSNPLQPSANQEVRLLTDKYTPADIAGTPLVEMNFDLDSQRTIRTGTGGM